MIKDIEEKIADNIDNYIRWSKYKKNSLGRGCFHFYRCYFCSVNSASI